MPTSPLPPDPYKILGVAKDATKATVRSAYKKLVLLSHPDKFPDEATKAQKAEEFHLVQQAYEILSEDKTRENYDARVRLAELKAERFREEASSPKRQDPPYSPRPSAERVWTSQPIFEEIRPRRHYEDHPPPPPPLSRPVPRYEEQPYRERSYDDWDDFFPQGTTKKAGTSRSSEARPDDTSNRARSRWKQAIPKVAEKHRENEERRRTRDKGRRDDNQSKQQYNRSSLDGGTASETDPEVEAFMKSSHGHKKESSRSYDDDRHHSRRKYESRTSSPDREAKFNNNMYSAAQYIAKSQSGKPASTRRSSVGRGQSANQLPPPPPPAPSVPISAAVEEVTRSSARRNATSKASKSSTIEIVDPAPSRKRDYDTDPRVSELKASATSPATLKPSRSNTMEVRGSERSEPSRASIRRATTSPLTQSASTSHSQKSSKLGRDIHASGYSSPVTPDNQTPRSKKTTYTYVESDSESDGARVININPKHHRPQPTREESLHSMPYRSERATASSGSTRHVTGKSHTDESASHHRRPVTLNRGATDRGGALYGELRASPEPRVQYESRRYVKDDIHYATYHRRSSDNDPHAYGRRTSVPIRSGRAQEVKGC